LAGVSILGLVDKGLRHQTAFFYANINQVSILGLVDKGLRLTVEIIVTVTVEMFQSLV